MRDIFRLLPTMPLWGLPGGASGKEPDCQCRRCKRFRFDPWIEKIPWRKSWQSTPVFLPGESRWTEEPGGLQSRGPKELGTTERLSTTWQPLNLHHLCKLASILYFLINSKLCKIISVGFAMKDYLSTVLSLKSRVVIFFLNTHFAHFQK